MSHEAIVITGLALLAITITAISARHHIAAFWRRGCSGCIVEGMGGYGFTPHTCLFGKTRRDASGKVRAFQGPFRDRNFDAKGTR